MTWYNTDFPYRKLITINGNMISGNHIDFPFLWNKSSDSDLASHTLNDGKDIVFVIKDTNTRVNHEIEFYDGTTGSGNIWVKVPTLNQGINTELYMYYGDEVDHTQDVTYKPSGVWSEFSGVFHLSSSTLSFSSNSAPIDTDPGGHPDCVWGDLEVNANQVYWPLTTSGKIGNGAWFDGVNDFYSLNEYNPVFTPSGNMTISLWYNCHGKPVKDNTSFINLMEEENPLDFMMFNMHVGAEHKYLSYIASDINGTQYYISTNTGHKDVEDDAWHMATITYDKDNGIARVMTDGIKYVGEQSSLGNYANPAHLYHIFIGFSLWKTTYWSGSIDEVRIIEGTAKSKGWVATCYSTQSASSDFFTLGSEENQTTNNLIISGDGKISIYGGDKLIKFITI